jgi:hypothetical protein
MVKKILSKDHIIFWLKIFFCLISTSVYLSSPQIGFAYHTPSNGIKWSLHDLVEQSQGAVRQINDYYIINDNVIIADQDTLCIGSTEILVLDCSKNIVRLTVEGNLETAPGCSSIIADKPIHTAAELDSYQRYPGIIYDDLGVRRHAQPKIRSTSTAGTNKLTSFSLDTVSIIQGTVTDASTGQPIPARISIRKSDGQYVCDIDCAGNPVNYINAPGFWITNGSFTSGVSAGTTDITVSQGYEYIPYHGTFDIASGEIRTLAISLTPIISMNSIGWYAGDAHNHVSHGEKQYQTNIPYAARIARGQGYDWFYAGKGWSTETYTPAPPASYYLDTTSPDFLHALTRQASTTDFLCLWGQEEPKDFMGHEVALGITDWQTLNHNLAYSVMVSYPHFELVKEIQNQGGLAIYTHPLRELGTLTDPLNYPGESFLQNLSRELPLDILVVPEFNPMIDFMTDNYFESYTPSFWYYLLNKGYRIGCAAFTDSCFDRIDCSIGHNMTYTHIPDTSKNHDGSLIASSIVDAFKQSRTFGTQGPLVLFSIDSHIPGDIITIQGNTTFQVQIQTCCVNKLGYYLKRIELIRNGLTIQSCNFSELSLQSVTTTFNFNEDTQAWYIVRVVGTWQGVQPQVAYTSPIYFALGSSYQSPQPVSAHVTGNIFDLGIPDPIDAQIDILNFGEVIQSSTAAHGTFDITIPATSRIRVSYGNVTVTKSIFLDYKPLYDKIVRCQATDISTPGFYDELINLLGNIELEFTLPLEATNIRHNWMIYR